MSVTEPTKEEVTEEPQLQEKTGEEEEATQINDETKDEQGQERNEDDQKQIQNGGGGSTIIDVDQDAQEMVISSLRTQVQDLFSQVNQLNNKLVGSYDRVSDLEDSLHVTTTNLQLSNQKVNQLELEKTQHLSQLTSGSLVEKSHVTAELTRLMERATEEAAQRGQAESAKEKIERELEELSASLFGEANGMVHEARVARSLSERKVDDAEGRLREAEEAVRMMQSQMQTLMQEKEDVERNPGALSNSTTTRERLMKCHLAYHEYIAFLAHLRHLHISNPNGVPPAMSTLLQLPFLSRLLTEDSEPTLRLDLAPSLNWLSRRSVLSAIHTAQLSVEPISAGTLFTLSMESPLITIAGMSPSSLNVMTAKLEDLDINIPCALCGSSIFPIDTTPTSSNSYSTTITTQQSTLTPHFSSVHITMPSTTTWSAAAGSFFRKPIPLTRALSSTPTTNGLSINGTSTSPNTTPSPSSTTTQSVHPMAKSKHLSFHVTPQTQIHIFRLASPPSSTSSALASFSLPLSKSSSSSPSRPPSTSGSASSSRPTSSASLTSSTTVASSQPTTYYPLCTSGWCLARLRATCTLWSFIRTGIVEKVWDEEVILPTPPASPSRTSSSGSTATTTATSTPTVDSSNSSMEPLRQGKAPPPLPPRRRGLWGIASALGERAASWSEGGSKEKRESKGSTPSNEAIVPGGGRHVTLIKTGTVPPGLNDKLNSSETESAPSSLSTLPPPPPLPKRSVNRSLSHRGENNSSPSPTSKAQAESSTSSSPTDVVHTSSSSPSPVRKNPPHPAKSVAHIRNPSLTHAVNTPLPESRAGTPSLPAVELKINGSNVDKTPMPSRTSSPALPVMGGTPLSKPPVPRRAAARNKGVVVGSSLDDEKVKKKDQLDHMTGIVELADSKVGVTMAPKEEGAVPESEGKEEESDKPESALVEEEKVDIVQLADKKTDELIISESESGEKKGMDDVNKAVEDEDEKKDKLPTSLPDTQLQEDNPPDISHDDDDETIKVDQTQYVGTSTWEEKMWRELVRIRKEMFYARMGAVDS